jgi:hypothetical protein
VNSLTHGRILSLYRPGPSGEGLTHNGMHPFGKERRPTKVAAIALANKIARMAWAMMAKGERYKETVALAA